MKNDQAKEFVIAILKQKGTVTAQEINYESKGTLKFIQIYNTMSALLNNESVQLNKSDGKKTYTLIDAEKLNDQVPKNVKSKPEKEKAVKEIEEDEPKEKIKKKIGRDLTKYTFNNETLNKSRLALAIITFYCKQNKPSHKMLNEVFPTSIVPPYGTWNLLPTAIEKSKEYARFFTNENDIISTKQGPIAVSNQLTTERIEKIISIAKKLGYKIN